MNPLTGRREVLKIGKFNFSIKSQSRFLLFAACSVFNDKHTASNIAAKLDNIFKQFGIASKAWFVCTDNAATMVRGNI